jgi:tRNA(Ile)-lysidine synthase
MDSAVLLHAAACFAKSHQIEIEAIHINHQLQTPSNQWAKHCQAYAKGFGVHCRVHELSSKPAKGQSIEEWARSARYEHFKSLVKAKEVLLLAQHMDDQAETLLLQLMRGAGPRGLSAMPKQARFAKGIILRPLLELTRDQLQQYALSHDLSFIEDPSNQDIKFDRNFIRHEIMPIFKKRWPHAAQSIALSSLNCQEQEQVLDICLQEKLLKVQPKPQVLAIDKLQSFSLIEQNAILRQWLKHEAELDIGREVLNQIHEIIHAKDDAEPLLSLQQWEIRRYQNHVHLLHKLPDVPEHYEVLWNGEQPLEVPTYPMPLTKDFLAKQGLAVDEINWNKVSVKLRCGGERCQPKDRSRSQTLKKCLQEYHILPWMRDRLPLIYENNQILMVVDAFVCAKNEPK